MKIMAAVHVEDSGDSLLSRSAYSCTARQKGSAAGAGFPASKVLLSFGTAMPMVVPADEARSSSGALAHSLMREGGSSGPASTVYRSWSPGRWSTVQLSVSSTGTSSGVGNASPTSGATGPD